MLREETDAQCHNASYVELKTDTRQVTSHSHLPWCATAASAVAAAARWSFDAVCESPVGSSGLVKSRVLSLLKRTLNSASFEKSTRSRLHPLYIFFAFKPCTMDVIHVQFMYDCTSTVEIAEIAGLENAVRKLTLTNMKDIGLQPYAKIKTVLRGSKAQSIEASSSNYANILLRL